MTRIRVVDTETTGMDPAEGAALLEAAHVDVVPASDGGWMTGLFGSWMIRHDGPIPPEARAVHHIGPGDVDALSGAEPREIVVPQLLTTPDGETGIIFAAHNAKFDAQFLPELPQPWICTWTCAQHLIPDAPRHSNQVLRYYLGLEPDPVLTAGLAPHRALYDTAITAELMIHLLGLASPEELIRLTAQPILLKKIPFGKHRDTLFSEAPRDYLAWILRTGGFDEDVMHTARHYLGR